MKNTIKNLSIVLLSLLSVNLIAQRTIGGSKKNYEQYHVIYDTTYEKVAVPIEKYYMRYFTVSAVLPNATSKELPADFWTKWENNGNWAYPLETGQIGAQTSFGISFGSFSGLNFINKNLITDIDFGFESVLSLSTIRYNWSGLSATMPSSYVQLDKDVYADLITSCKGMIGIATYSFGLGIAYHTPVDGLDVRFSALYSPSFYWGSIDQVEGEVYDNSSSSTLALRVESSYYDESQSGFVQFGTYKIGANYGAAYLGVTVNTGGQIIDEETTHHTLDIDFDNGSYFTGSWNRNYYTNFKLSNISVDLGITF